MSDGIVKGLLAQRLVSAPSVEVVVELGNAQPIWINAAGDLTLMASIPAALELAECLTRAALAAKRAKDAT